MGRDDHNNKVNSKTSGSLPQTPKNEKISPSRMKEETAKELAELTQRNILRKKK